MWNFPFQELRNFSHLPEITPNSTVSYDSPRGDSSVRPLQLRMKTVGNGRKTPKLFSTFTFEYENKSENGKARHKNEHKLTEYQEFRKRTNSSGIMSNTVGIRKINKEYRPVLPSA